MEQQAQIQNVRAEMLLGYLYPELRESWRVECKGAFYRNYSEDILGYDPEAGVVELSRDGLLKLLPPGAVSVHSGGADVKEFSQKQQEELSLLSELFVPFDSLLFRLNMALEDNLSQILDGFEAYVLREYFGYDLSAEQNKYVRMLLPLLVYVHKLRADYNTLADILSRITGHKVSYTMDGYSHSDREGVSLLRITFAVDAQGLSGEEFRSLDEQLAPLFAVVREWLLPFDYVCEFRLRDINANEPRLAERNILSYNTRIKR